MEFKDKLKSLRKERGLSQQALADAIFISRSAVAKWENGLGLPSDESMNALLNYFDVPKECFATDEPEKVLLKKNQVIRRMALALTLSVTILGLILLLVPAMLVAHEIVLPFQIQETNRLITQGDHEKLESYVKWNRLAVKSWPFAHSLVIAVTDSIPVDSPLATACMENDPEAVAILLKYGADPNYVPIFQNRNYTPLTLAASRGNQQTMTLLLKSGADASVQGTGALRAYLLHRSREATPNAEDLQIVIALLEKYGFTMPTALENSPMEYAAIYGDTQAMQLLISDYAVDANACIDNGRTILHIYVRSGHQIATAEKVAAILAFGTDPTIADEDGKTAYDYAVEKGYEDIAQMLQLES